MQKLWTMHRCKFIKNFTPPQISTEFYKTLTIFLCHTSTEASRRKLQAAAFACPFAAPVPRFSGGRGWLNGGERKNLVKAASLSAQSVRGAFAIVKVMWREDLRIIKKRRICSVQIPMKSKKIFTFKHLVKIISEQIFTLLLIIFTVI